MAKVTELEEHGQLLKECGSFPPAGKKDEPGFWDLAGNVAGGRHTGRQGQGAGIFGRFTD